MLAKLVQQVVDLILERELREYTDRFGLFELRLQGVEIQRRACARRPRCCGGRIWGHRFWRRRFRGGCLRHGRSALGFRRRGGGLCGRRRDRSWWRRLSRSWWRCLRLLADTCCSEQQHHGRVEDTHHVDPVTGRARKAPERLRWKRGLQSAGQCYAWARERRKRLRFLSRAVVLPSMRSAASRRSDTDRVLLRWQRVTTAMRWRCACGS